MKKLLLVALVLMSFGSSNAAIFRENHILVSVPFFCIVSKNAVIFTYPPKTLHLLSIYSVHWNHDTLDKVRNVHAQAKLAWRTDQTSKGHVTWEGFTATKVVMHTEFFTRQCIPDGIIEIERNKRTSKDC